MADEASNTLSGGIRNFLGAGGFLAMMFGGYFLYERNDAQIGLTLIAVGLPIFISPWAWDRLRHFFWPKDTHPKELDYLSNRDSELGSAIQTMTRASAWGRWYAAQILVNSGSPVGDRELLHTACFNVLEKIVDGELDVRGRLPGEMDYSPIPRTYWRASALTFIPNNVSLWKLVIVPRGGAEIEPDGTVIARNAEAAARTAHIAVYDSLIVDGFQFERIWPKHKRDSDRARQRLLRQARRRKLEKAEIQRLSDPAIWQRPQFWFYSFFSLGLVAGCAIALWLSPQFFYSAPWSLPSEVGKGCISGANPTEMAAQLGAKLRQGVVLARGRRIVFSPTIRDFVVEKEVTELRPGDWQNLELTGKLDSAAGSNGDRYTALEMKVVRGCR